MAMTMVMVMVSVNKSSKSFLPIRPLLVLAACMLIVLLARQMVASLASPTFNVKEAGAKGDGVTDDTGVFMRVLRQAGTSGRGATVVVPPGTYLLSPGEPLPLLGGVALRGLGRPVLKFRERSGARYGFEAFSIHGLHIRMDGNVIDGGNRLTRGIGIHTGSSDVRITGSVIRQLSQPDDPGHPLYSTVVAGIMLYGDTKEISIRGCTITGVSAGQGSPVARGIMAWSEPGRTIARRVSIKGNMISHITPREDADGVFFDKPSEQSPLSHSVIEGNVIHHAAKRGIKIAAPGVVVRNNRIVNPYFGDNRYLNVPKDPLPQDMYAAISVYASQVTVSGNIIGGAGSYYAAIEADAGPLTAVVIENNVISGGPASAGPGPNTSGIRLGEVRGFRVTGNKVGGVETSIRLSDEAKAGLEAGTGTIADNVLKNAKAGE